MKNSNKSDDIDLLIITQPHSLWLTRFLVTLIFEIFHLRRHPKAKHPQDKICLNLFLSLDDLEVKKPYQNLYTAHEVVQALPIVNKNQTHQLFLLKNSWLKKYLPNFPLPDFTPPPIYKSSPSLLETLSFRLQSWYMKSKITHERISLSQAFFHPRKTSQIVLKAYQTRQQKYL